MTATNHALTGAAIGLIIAQPIVAIPVAFLSHFVCDAIPHYRSSIKGENFLKTKSFSNYLVAEVILCILIVLVIALNQPNNWALAIICAFLAASPDLFSFKRYRYAKENKNYKPGKYVKFASGIQWFEKPIGATVEFAWFIAGIAILAAFLYP